MTTKTMILLLALLFPAASADVSGVWNVEASAGGNTITPVCTFKQKGNSLTGACKYNNDNSELTGEVKGSEVMWKYDMAYDGEPISLTYYGKIEPAGQMKGTVQVAPVGLQGEFSAKKQ